MKTIKQELIGLEIKVDEAKNPSNIGIEGKIVDETQQTLTIKTKKGQKRLIKKNITLTIKSQKIKIKGSLLVGRPEDRIKKKIK